MKMFQRICCLTCWLLIGAICSVMQAQSYAQLWKQMEQAQEKGLPKTMMKVADQIIQKAELEQNAPQLLKATVWGEYVQSRLTPDSIYAGIRHLEAWIKSEKNPVNRSILYALLAERYQDELWKSARYRSDLTDLTVEEASVDIREWSVRMLAAKVDDLLKASLHEEEALLHASAKDYQPFVILGEGSQFYAHDMYHLLARRALNTYERMKGYRLDSLMDSRISNLYRSMAEVYAHRSGVEEAALLTALEWVKRQRDEAVRNIPYGEYDDVRRNAGHDYLRRLDSLKVRYQGKDVCAEVYISKASWLKNVSNGSLLEGLRACEEGIKLYPKYKRINQLRNIRLEIQHPLLGGNMLTQLYPGDTLKMEVRYRNVPGFTWCVYRTAFAQIPELNDRIKPDFIRKNGRKIFSRHIALKPTPKLGRLPEEWNYMRSDTVIQAVLPAEPGVYIVQMIPDGGETPMLAQFFVQSCFRALTLDLGTAGKEILVLDAQSGHPIAGVDVVGYDVSYVSHQEKVLQTLKTDMEGKAVFTHEGVLSYSVQKGKDTALPRQSLGADVYYANGQANEEKCLTLLTDRAIYRPGQTVYVKGVAYRQKGWDATVLKDVEYELVLLDANRKELSSRKMRTNDFGSFTAEFVLPSACLNGEFSIQSRDCRVSKRIRVEEYKRPAFEIQFLPLTEAYCRGEKVVVKGGVQAFNGSTVQEVPLVYTLTRTRINSYRVEEPERLKQDTVKLDNQGNFEIPVDLLYLEGKQRKQMPSDSREKDEYQLEVVVTNESGETQTATYSFTVLAERYLISCGLPRFLCKEDFVKQTIHVSNANLVPQSVAGTVALYRKNDWLKQQKASLSTSFQKVVNPVWQGTFVANQPTDFSAWSHLPSGEYFLQIVVRDSLGREQVYPSEVSEHSSTRSEGVSLVLYSKHDHRLPTFEHLFCQKESDEFDEHHPAVLHLGTSHQGAYVLMDVFHNRERIDSKALQLNDSLMRMEWPYQKAYGEGISVLFTMVKNGEVYSTWKVLKKKQPNRQLDLKWKVFRDRLRPGQPEEWTLTLSRPDSMPVAAEMLAMLYDASLDKLHPHHQYLAASYIPSFVYHRWYDHPSGGISLLADFSWQYKYVPHWTYDVFFTPVSAVENAIMICDRALAAHTLGLRGARSMYKSADRSDRLRGGDTNALEVKYVPVQVEEESPESQQVLNVSFETSLEETVVGTVSEANSAELTRSVRKNFAETAFFYPQLRTNEQGEIVFSFTMPESLTRWNFCAFAHTRDMYTGQLNEEVVTAKEFMLKPNIPRFLRVTDRTQVAAVIANLTGKSVKGLARLTLFDPLTEKVVLTRKQKFSVDEGRNSVVKFDFQVDNRYPLLGVRVEAEGGNFSDGEQWVLPVLSNRVTVTETLPMTVRGYQQKDFSLSHLFNNHGSSATNRRLTMEFTGNPAWYAVQALPTISVPNTDNATAYAVALYAQTLAAYIAGSQPKIQQVIAQWQQMGGTKETFRSELEKNQELKNILLNESPWLLEATTEQEQRARLMTLFDLNQLKDRQYAALSKLKELQLANGAWSWYKGMYASFSMTAYITELLIRLPLLMGQTLQGETLALCQRAFNYLHQQALQEYQSVLKAEKSGAKITIPSAAALQYLYLIALSGEKLPEANQKAYLYWMKKVPGLLEVGNVMQKSKAVVILWKSGNKTLARDFVASLVEHLIQEEEMGAHFAFLDTPERWGMMPVSVHVSAMEALQCVGGYDAWIEAMKLWLLKQKQSTSWRSSVATADAVYALLCTGRNLLTDSGEVQIILGNSVFHTNEADAAMVGLNYVKETFSDNSAEVEAERITVHNRHEGMAWGAVYAQYAVPLNEVKSQSGALQVKKQLFVERVAGDGHKTLQSLTEGVVLKVGDKVVSRLTIQLDRAMDFIQLKDQRAACLEPLASLSGYRWMQGFGGYVEIDDAATNYFFDRLGKGVYVLENSCRLVREGVYESGIATIQSAYAPEFAAHAAGMKLVCE